MSLPPTGVILAAAGQGRRLGSRLPKALVPIAGRPMFLYSLRTFASLPFVREIVLVLPRNWIDRIHRDRKKELLDLGVRMLVPGGTRRQDSVEAGLRLLSTPLVLVHDAARPFVTAKAARAVAAAAARNGAALLAAPAVDTIKIADARGRVQSTPDRSLVWHAQTPQAFRREVLLRAYAKNRGADATDDVQMVERAGGKVALVRSTEDNFKVTTREDLARAERRLRKSRFP